MAERGRGGRGGGSGGRGRGRGMTGTAPHASPAVSNPAPLSALGIANDLSSKLPPPPPDYPVEACSAVLIDDYGLLLGCDSGACSSGHLASNDECTCAQTV